MAGQLEGKIAVVAAAGQGIGRAIAEAFAAEGATVHASDRDIDKLDGLNAAKARLDVTDTEAVEAYAGAVGGIDILANVAGFVHHGTVLECSEDDWDFSFDLNVKSMHRMIRAFLPEMLTRAAANETSGSIVNMSSIASHLGYPVFFAYTAAKGAVRAMSKAVSVHCQMHGYNIRVNSVHPGAIDTPMIDKTTSDLGLDDKTTISPVGLGQPEDVANAVLFLASDESRFVNGTEIIIDNAMSIQ